MNGFEEAAEEICGKKDKKKKNGRRNKNRTLNEICLFVVRWKKERDSWEMKKKKEEEEKIWTIVDGRDEKRTEKWRTDSYLNPKTRKRKSETGAYTKTFS